MVEGACRFYNKVLHNNASRRLLGRAPLRTAAVRLLLRRCVVADPKHGDEWTRVSKDVEHGLAQLSCDAALKRVAANLALGKSASGS